MRHSGGKVHGGDRVEGGGIEQSQVTAVGVGVIDRTCLILVVLLAGLIWGDALWGL
jgi:hypothetical protein